jgi:hypothetical protein
MFRNVLVPVVIRNCNTLRKGNIAPGESRHGTHRREM